MAIDPVVVDIYGFSLSYDLEKTHDEMVKKLYGQEPLNVNHHPAKSDSQTHSGSGDIFLVCDMIVQEHIVKM